MKHNNTAAKSSKHKTLKRFVELFSDKRSYLRRLSIIAPVWLALCFTVLFFGPLELVAYNGSSFVYSFHDVMPILATFAGGVFIVGVPVLPLIRGKIFNYVTTVLISLGTAAYLQAMFFNGNLGELNGDSVDYLQMKGDMLLSLLMWVGILVLLLFIMYLKRSFWRGFVSVLSVLITLSQLVPLICICSGAFGDKVSYPDHEYYLSCEDMFEYSEEHNVLVFVLDRLDYDYISTVRYFYPDFFDKLDGFTDYTNAITTYARTKPALSHILSGYEECAYDLGKDYYTKAWTDSDKNIFADLKKAGYHTDIYAEMDTMFGDDELAAQYADNADYGKVSVPKKEILKKMLNLSAYRYSPTALKPFFTYDTNYYNSGATVLPITEEQELYVVDESKYIEGFENLSIVTQSTESETSSDECATKCFKFYHFNGPHSPFYMNEDGTRNEDCQTDNVVQTMGSFSILYRIFDRMKELGIYENSAIIITADHGRAISDTEPLQKETRVGLFYKPSGSADTPLVENSAPISTYNLGATILKEAGADYSAYGKAVDEIAEDENIVRTYYKTVVNSDPDTPNKLYTYDVIGDASVFENWIEKEVRDLADGVY